MSRRGICSRREADRIIESGQVLVDGIVVSTLGTKVREDADIQLLSKAKQEKAGKVTVLLNKPIGYVSTQGEKGYPEAIELITAANQHKGTRFSPGFLKKLAVAGRLDIDSKGLLLFTQDGALAKKIIGENSSIEKEYLVRIEGNLTDQHLQKLRKGLSLDGEKLKPAVVEVLSDGLLKFILIEGKKRQIRRMCEMVKLHVTGIKRVRIGNINLADLPEGKWRLLRSNEVV